MGRPVRRVWQSRETCVLRRLLRGVPPEMRRVGGSTWWLGFVPPQNCLWVIEFVLTPLSARSPRATFSATRAPTFANNPAAVCPRKPTRGVKRAPSAAWAATCCAATVARRRCTPRASAWTACRTTIGFATTVPRNGAARAASPGFSSTATSFVAPQTTVDPCKAATACFIWCGARGLTCLCLVYVVFLCDGLVLLVCRSVSG